MSKVLEARSFFEGMPPTECSFPAIALRWGQLSFSINGADLERARGTNPLQSSVMQGLHVRRYLKEEKITSVIKHWPRLLRALEEAEIAGLVVGQERTVYPIEVLAVSPELLVDTIEEGDEERVVTLLMKENADRFGFGLDEYYSASFLNQAQDFARAMDMIEQALVLQPRNVVFLVLKGTIQGRLEGQLKAACAIFKSVYDVNPRYAKNYLKLALVLEARKKYDQALVALHKGHDAGVFEIPAVGLKLFTLGRSLVKLTWGVCGPISAVNRHFGFEIHHMDNNIWFAILDKLYAWNLVAFRLVCISWNTLYLRYIQVRFGDSLEWQAQAKTLHGYKRLFIEGRLDSTTWLPRTKRSFTDFGYFFDQWLKEPRIVWDRFLAFLEHHGFAKASHNFPLCVSIGAQTVGNFVQDVFTLSGALCEATLRAVYLIPVGPTDFTKSTYRFFYVNVPGTCVYMARKHKPFKGEGQVRIAPINRETETPFPFPRPAHYNGMWMLPPDPLELKPQKQKGVCLADLLHAKSMSDDPALQPWNFPSAYRLPL